LPITERPARARAADELEADGREDEDGEGVRNESRRAGACAARKKKHAHSSSREGRHGEASGE